MKGSKDRENNWQNKRNSNSYEKYNHNINNNNNFYLKVDCS